MLPHTLWIRQAALPICMHGMHAPAACAGDNKETAGFIARECGILGAGGVVMEGVVFRGLPEEERLRVVPRLQVHAVRGNDNDTGPRDPYLCMNACMQGRHAAGFTSLAEAGFATAGPIPSTVRGQRPSTADSDALAGIRPTERCTCRLSRACLPHVEASLSAVHVNSPLIGMGPSRDGAFCGKARFGHRGRARARVGLATTMRCSSGCGVRTAGALCAGLTQAGTVLGRGYVRTYVRMRPDISMQSNSTPNSQSAVIGIPPNPRVHASACYGDDVPLRMPQMSLDGWRCGGSRACMRMHLPHV